MRRLPEIRLPFDHSPEDLERAVAQLAPGARWRLLKKSLDARRKDRIVWVYAVGLPEEDDERREPPPRRRAPDPRPVVVGAGPGGLFAALRLAEAGVPPLVLEQGEAMPERVLTMARFMRSGVLDPRSNLGFGAGGAGAYSDGKLMTRIRSPHIPEIMETLVGFGAPEEIRWLANPHLGSSRIRRAIHLLIQELGELGVEVRFRTRVASFSVVEGRVTGVVLEDGSEVEASAVLLAGGRLNENRTSLRDRGRHLPGRFSLRNVSRCWRCCTVIASWTRRPARWWLRCSTRTSAFAQSARCIESCRRRARCGNAAISSGTPSTISPSSWPRARTRSGRGTLRN